jgi:hypothetical protein
VAGARVFVVDVFNVSEKTRHGVSVLLLKHIMVS